MRDWFHGFIKEPGFYDRYFHYALLLTKVTPVQDPSVGSMGLSCLSGRFYLHVNVEYFRENPQYLNGILLHEVHHMVLGHTTHPKFLNPAYPDLMTVAMEISANEYIQEPLPNPVLCERYEEYGVRPGQSTMERYDLLAKARNEGKLSQAQRPDLVDHHFPGGKPDQQRKQGIMEADPWAHDSLLDLMKEVEEEGKRKPGSSRKKGGPGGLLAGRSPGEILEQLEAADRRPVNSIDWKKALRIFFSEERDIEFLYTRPNRRFPQEVGIIPGCMYQTQFSEKPRIIAAIDTSGSMSAEDLAEIGRQLLHMRPLAEITVVECDTRIQRVYPLKESMDTVMGRGGTDLKPVFDPAFLREHDPAGVVYFTDGCGPYPEVDPRVKTLWVLTWDHGFTCPWGKRVIMNKGEHPGLRGRAALIDRLLRGMDSPESVRSRSKALPRGSRDLSGLRGSLESKWGVSPLQWQRRLSSE